MMRKVELLRETFTSQGRQGPGVVEVTQADYIALQEAEKVGGIALMKAKTKPKAKLK